MAISTLQQQKLKKVVKELQRYRGSHTELVSVYIPKGYEMSKIINHLSQEQGTATNIKSTSTRKNVIAALEKMIQHLRLFKRTPENGLAVFSGNVAEREGQQDVKVWSIEPPIALKTRIYRCDKEFQLDLLRDMLEVKEIYGMIVMDRRDAIIATLKGKTITPLLKTHSEVPGKIRAGGQSSQRYARIREGAAKDHYKKVAEYAKEQFLGNKDLKGILVGGPGPTKYDFIEYITTDVKNKIIAIRDLGYTGEFGLQELLDKCEDVLADEEVMKEKKVISRFFNLLSTKPKMVSYGEADVVNKLQIGAVETLLISETLDDKTIENYEEQAQKIGADIQIISVETREGAQLKEVGKVCAILRYEA